jgi:hypothetical protein
MNFVDFVDFMGFLVASTLFAFTFGGIFKIYEL